LDGDPAHTVLVAGSGRSGTTWLGDVVNFDDSFRVIFEPFNPLRVESWRPFGSRQYQPPDNPDPDLFRAVHTILSGLDRSDWTASHNRCFWARKRVVKEIAINNMLGYIANWFPQVRLVYLLRHPFAVASSRLRHGWHTYPDPTVRTNLDIFLRQPLLMADYLEPFRPMLMRPMSPFAKEVAFWAAENYVPLQQLRDRVAVKIVHYEDLVLRERETIADVFSHVGRKYDRRLEEMIDRPSGTSGRSSPVKSRETELLAGWTGRPEKRDIQDGMRVLESFQLDSIYNDKPIPVCYQ
jgi:hypothetical protein